MADWIGEGTPLTLEFHQVAGGVVVLPDPGHHYVVKLDRR